MCSVLQKPFLLILTIKNTFLNDEKCLKESKIVQKRPFWQVMIPDYMRFDNINYIGLETLLENQIYKNNDGNDVILQSKIP